MNNLAVILLNVTQIFKIYMGCSKGFDIPVLHTLVIFVYFWSQYFT